MTDTSLYLRNQLVFACCEHCSKRDESCKAKKGHYVKCTTKGCIVGGARKV